MLEIPPALDQIAHLNVESQPAPVFARTARVLPQTAAFNDHRAFELDALDRPVAHVALADRDCRRDSVFRRPSTPAATFDALDNEPPVGLGMHAKKHHRT